MCLCAPVTICGDLKVAERVTFLSVGLGRGVSTWDGDGDGDVP